MSIFFYASSETKFVIIFLLLVLFNFILAFFINKSLAVKRKIYLILGIVVNLSFLLYYKYLGFLISEILNPLLLKTGSPLIQIPSVYLPLAISFFTFHTLSYIIDVYKKTVEPEKKLRNLALYLFMFPHLIAGPIVRFTEIKDQIRMRITDLEIFRYGLTRFIIGLSKKVILADNIAEIANKVFSTQPSAMTIETAWIGLISFTLQIYLDFSAYSDMAIGLASMFGFKFPENFNYPYIASSIREFWQRWHMTLYRWFRDYVYIPLGGNRLSEIRIYINIMLVFSLTGLWHGAGWNFIIWGAIHGAALVFERSRPGIVLKLLGRPIGHIYTLLVVMIGWVFFRSNSLNYSLAFLNRLFVPNLPVNQEYSSLSFVSPESILALIAGIIISLPIYPVIVRLGKSLIKNQSDKLNYQALIFRGLYFIYFITIFIFAIFVMITQGYKTFLYFRF